MDIESEVDEQKNSDDSEENVNKKIKKHCFIGPAIFCIYLGWNLSTAVFTNEIVYQICKVSLGFNDSDCKLLGTENTTEEIQSLETKVQPYATTLKMVRQIVESFFPAIVNLFFGNWSDKYGRKPILISCVGGYFITYFLLSMISYLSTIRTVSPWYYVLAFIPISFTGGNCCLTTGAYAYISDVSTNVNRAFNMGMLEVCIFSGLLFGSISTSYIYNATNTTTMFILSSVCIFVGLLYIIWFVDESIVPRNEDLEGKSKIRELFRISLVWEIIKTCTKKRQYFGRTIIWLTIIALGINMTAVSGGIGVFYLYVRERFQWTLRDYTFYEATAITTQIFGNLFAMFILIRWVKMPVSILVIIAYFSNLLDTAITAAAFYSWHLYLALGVSFLKALASPMCRAVLAIVVKSNDLGKIYSLTTSIETFLPILSALLYTYVYNKTLTFYPAAYNLVSVTLYGICVGIMGIVYVYLKKRRSVDMSLDN